MGVVMERWCPTQPVLGVFLGDGSEETAFSWDHRAADGNIGKCSGLALLSQCAHLRMRIKLRDMSVPRQLEA
jgi:hypothetical protein